MRTIKFRAYTEISNEVLGMKYDVAHNYNEFVMQFTGLLDKLGKEIYEGDIIDNGGALQKYEVIFHKGCFCISQGGLGYHIFNEKEAEILGDIYQNPELIN